MYASEQIFWLLNDEQAPRTDQGCYVTAAPRDTLFSPAPILPLDSYGTMLSTRQRECETELCLSVESAGA